ncbi:MAG: A/G-specific adenine glycosylase, partial [Spirochaetales bacterium]
HKRPLPWRETQDPYYILVSEVMLQQTQVARVLEKYPLFIAAFPGFPALREAPLAEVLRLWQGMGYNRRALALKTIAEKTITEYGGRLPDDPRVLETFPMIGRNTAASITAFAFNRPAVFIETNIRTVFIHFFFPDEESVNDRDLLPLVEKTMDRSEPCLWYNALMDYGVMLKSILKDINKKSSHYSRQKPFAGSDRELRGRLLKLASEQEGPGIYDIAEKLGEGKDRVLHIAEKMAAEGFFTIRGGKIIIAGIKERS